MQPSADHRKRAEELLSGARSPARARWCKSRFLSPVTWLHPEILHLAIAERESLLATARRDVKVSSTFWLLLVAGTLVVVVLLALVPALRSGATASYLGITTVFLAHGIPYNIAVRQALRHRRAIHSFPSE